VRRLEVECPMVRKDSDKTSLLSSSARNEAERQFLAHNVDAQHVDCLSDTISRNIHSTDAQNGDDQARIQL